MGVSFYIDTGLFEPTMSLVSTWRSINSYLLLGPLLLAFVIKLENPERQTRWFDALHLLPFICSFIFLLLMAQKDPSSFLQIKTERLDQIVTMPVTARFTLPYLMPAAHFIAYILFCSWRVFQFWLKNRIHSVRPQLYWLVAVLIMSYLMMLNVFVVFVVTIINQIEKSPTVFALADLAIIFGLFGVTFLLIHFGRPKSMSQRTKSVSAESTNSCIKNNNKVLTSMRVEQQQQLARIDELMTQKRIFLDPDLNQAKLAAKLQISRHQLSDLLALHPAGNFYELINKHRINAVINEIKKRPINVQLIVIAYDCGFNSKSNFNQVFKKHLNQTPSQFRKSVKT